VRIGGKNADGWRESACHGPHQRSSVKKHYRKIIMDKLWIVIAVVVLVAVMVKAMGTAKGNGAEAKEKIKMGALVLDVRTAAEYQGGHVDGALNIPVQELESRLGELKDKKRAIVVYCASGMRSAHAAKILATAGFMDVTNAGGWANLK
jgi:rhodanese-related sulfurtransferase